MFVEHADIMSVSVIFLQRIEQTGGIVVNINDFLKIECLSKEGKNEAFMSHYTFLTLYILIGTMLIVVFMDFLVLHQGPVA